MINFSKLKKKYLVSDLFTFNSLTNELIYNTSLKINLLRICIQDKTIDLESINYFVFDKTSYLKLNRAEIRKELLEFEVLVNYKDNIETSIKVIRSDDWIILQDVLRQLEIEIYTFNTLNIKDTNKTKGSVN